MTRPQGIPGTDAVCTYQSQDGDTTVWDWTESPNCHGAALIHRGRVVYIGTDIYEVSQLAPSAGLLYKLLNKKVRD